MADASQYSFSSKSHKYQISLKIGICILYNDVTGHRIRELLRLEVTSRDNLAQPPTQRMVSYNIPLRTTSSRVFNVSQGCQLHN